MLQKSHDKLVVENKCALCIPSLSTDLTTANDKSHRRSKDLIKKAKANVGRSGSQGPSPKKEGPVVPGGALLHCITLWIMLIKSGTDSHPPRAAQARPTWLLWECEEGGRRRPARG